MSPDAREGTAPARRARSSFPALAACLFVSGLGSLVLEVVWTRQLRLVFGSTTLAASTILVAYMLGLGFGGITGGALSRRIRDGVRAYGWMELAIGLYALAVPAALVRMTDLNRTLLYGLDFWPAALCRFGIALLLLILPTFLMGATLPVLVAAASRVDERVGRHTSLLYGINTVGAVVGVFLANFLLFEWLGISAASRFGALLDVGVGLVAILWLAPRMRRAEAASAEDVAAAAPAAWRGSDAAALATPTPLLVAYGIVGFTALVYEVAWTRALSMVLGGSIHGFAVMLGAFLAGIGIGSLAIRAVVERIERPVALFAGGVALLGLLAFLTTALFSYLPDLAIALVERWGTTGGATTALQVTVATLLMLPATLVLGALMPLLSRVIAERWASAGDAVGRVYFANTVGSALGAFLAGFVLVPTLGLAATIVFAAALDVAAAAYLTARLRTAPRRAVVLAAAAVALVVLPTPFDREALTRGVFRLPAHEMSFGIELEPYAGVGGGKLLYYRDGITGTVSVHDEMDTVLLKTNGKPDASSTNDVATQLLLGHLGLLFGPPARSALVIGFASGMTVGSVARHPELEKIDVVEIEPAMVEASHYFDFLNGRPLEDPRVRVIYDDGRAYLSGTAEKYDLIISEPSNPWLTGVSNLFTKEFFRSARAALRPDGRLLQWVQLYGIDERALRSILAAMRGEFPYIYAFAHVAEWPDLLLLGMTRPLGARDLPRWNELPDAVRRDLSRVGDSSDADLWSTLRLVPEEVDRLYPPGDTVNTDDNLLVELSTPWLMNAPTAKAHWSRFRGGGGGALPLLDDTIGPLDADAVAELAFSYAALRKDMPVAQRLIAVAESRGKSPTAIAAALAVARRLDPDLAADAQIATLDTALERSRDSFGAWLLRARVHWETDDADAGLADVAEALRLRPGEPGARLLRARFLAQKGELEEAQREYETLLSEGYDKVEPDLVRERARLFVARERPADAIPALEALLVDGDPRWPEGWGLLSRAYTLAGDAPAAERAARNAEIATRNQPRFFHQQARRALWSGERVDAAYLLGLTIGLAPQNEEAKLELAHLEAEAKGAKGTVRAGAPDR